MICQLQFVLLIMMFIISMIMLIACIVGLFVDKGESHTVTYVAVLSWILGAWKGIAATALYNNRESCMGEDDDGGGGEGSKCPLARKVGCCLPRGGTSA